MLLSLLTLNSLHHFKHLTLNNTLSPADGVLCNTRLPGKSCSLPDNSHILSISLSHTILFSMCVRQPRPECDSWHNSPTCSAYLLSFLVSLFLLCLCICVCVCDDLSFRMPLRTLSLHFFLFPCSILLQTSCEIF